MDEGWGGASAAARPAQRLAGVSLGGDASADRDQHVSQLNEHHFGTGHLQSNLKGHTISSGVVTALGQGVQFSMTLGSTMVLARMLGPSDFGLVAMATTILGLFRIFKEAGLSTATVQREGVTHAQVSNLFWINIAVSGVISVCVAASAPAVAWFYKDPRLIAIMLALAGTFLLTGSTVQHMALLNRQMRFKAVVQIASVAAGVALGIVMAWLNYGYWSLVGSQLVTPLLAGILAWTYSRWRPQFFVRRSGTRPLVRFGFDLAAGGFICSMDPTQSGSIPGLWLCSLDHWNSRLAPLKPSLFRRFRCCKVSRSGIAGAS